MALRDDTPTNIATIDYNDMKEKVTDLIRICISDDIMNHIIDITTPKDVFEELENKYMSNMFMNKLFAKQRLYSLKMYEEGDL